MVIEQSYSENCDDKISQFLKRCFYQSGQYSSEEHFWELDYRIRQKEVLTVVSRNALLCNAINFTSRNENYESFSAQGGKTSNRLYYLAVPPNQFVDAVRCASRRASSQNGWTRVIVEKPFGHDSESSSKLTRDLKQHLTEDQIFRYENFADYSAFTKKRGIKESLINFCRIDHHLGEELFESLLVLRFSNLVFEPLWSRNYIRNVQLIFSEDFGIEGRGRLDELRYLSLDSEDSCGLSVRILILLPICSGTSTIMASLET